MNLRLHGANPEKLYIAFGIEKPPEIIDFSTNANVLEFDDDIEVDYKALISNYPDDDCVLLRNLLAESIKCEAQNILVTNGSNEGIYLIASYFKDKMVGIFQPSYTEYEKAVTAYGGIIKYFYDIEDIPCSLDAVFICNPSNPTGKYIKTEVVETCIKNNPKTVFIIDEAYIDFLDENHVMINLDKHNNVYVLRSLTKIFHLSGIRIGYVLSAKENIDILKLRQPTWSVNAVAQSIALKYLNNNTFIPKTKEFYTKEKQRVITRLGQSGFEIVQSDVNFFLLKTKDDLSLITFLLKKGIVVRHTRNYHGLEGRYIRIALRKPFENDILINCLKEYQDNSCL